MGSGFISLIVTAKLSKIVTCTGCVFFSVFFAICSLNWNSCSLFLLPSVSQLPRMCIRRSCHSAGIRCNIGQLRDSWAWKKLATNANRRAADPLPSSSPSQFLQCVLRGMRCFMSADFPSERRIVRTDVRLMRLGLLRLHGTLVVSVAMDGKIVAIVCVRRKRRRRRRSCVEGVF